MRAGRLDSRRAVDWERSLAEKKEYPSAILTVANLDDEMVSRKGDRLEFERDGTRERSLERLTAVRSERAMGGKWVDWKDDEKVRWSDATMGLIRVARRVEQTE